MRGTMAIVVVGLALIGAAMSSRAAAAETEAPPTESVTLEFPSRHGFRIYVEVRPLVGVAVIRTMKGEGPLLRGRSSSAAYVAPVPVGPVEGRLDLEIPGIAQISGELVSSGVERSEASPAGCPGPLAPAGAVKFRGTFDFTGSGGYLSFDADHGKGVLERSGDPCAVGVPKEPKPDLFTYLESEVAFTNQNSAILTSELSLPGRLSFFIAGHYVDGGGTLFEARSLERLPGPVAVERSFDLLPAPGADFKVSSGAERPASARVHPPAPFSGAGQYSRARGSLVGSLSVDLLGKRVRLAGRDSKAGLFNLNPGF